MTPEPRPTTSIHIDGTTLTGDPRTIEQMLALETYSTPWRPAGATLARLVDGTMVGIPAGAMSRLNVGASIQLIRSLMFLYRLAIQGGHHATAVVNASLVLAELEKLAAAGSEGAEAALLNTGALFEQDGVAVEAFAAARARIEGQPE